MRSLLLAGALALAAPTVAAAAPCVTTGPDLVVDNITCQMSGVFTFTNVRVVNGGVIQVNPYTGGSKTATGNLELRAKTILVDATSKISAKASGYQTQICGDGQGPNLTAPGQGGCSVRDSGGGGAHFGGGGRGTKDITGTQMFPRDFEEDCGNGVTYDGMGVPSCPSVADCRNNDGLPTVAGAGFFHSIYQPEFGASGGDKGCRDGDGKTLETGGAGGGRIVLAGLNAGTGTITINGTLDATGRRGCGIENDSGGGGAGGTILVAGEMVTIGPTAVVTSAGGLGGDTQGTMSNGECPAPYQQNGTCDDCGGGGGGGIVSVLSVTSTISDRATFSVAGALGGVCPICNGEAGGGVGELQISGGYVGEFCDGFDNDFDGQTDENLGTISCNGMMTIQSCVGGVPQQCAPAIPGCQTPVTDTRSRFAVVVDTSGSMLSTLAGAPTFGDGSTGHAGNDFNGNGVADDSRLFKAKNALTNVIAAYPDVDFALARYHQDESLNRSCQESHNFECRSICCSYDNPLNNTGPAPVPACAVNAGTANPNFAVLSDSTPDEECINYAGNCGPPRRGADVVVGFGADINNYLMWMNGTETNFNAAQTQGSYCNFAGGGDCELRGTGPTPLANSLNAVEDYLTPIKACDLANVRGCRAYNTILLTDGAESCQGDPVAAAAALRMKGINTFVVGFSTLPAETAQLNQVATAGGTGNAFLVGDEDALANALASIVSNSVVFETCNNLDDDCDTRIDEDFPGKGNACDNGKMGVCRATGQLVCAANGSGLVCNAPAGTAPSAETCNMLDDDCDGKVDEGVAGCMCIPQGEQCDNDDDDCDGKIDEGITRACGTGTCQGTETCVAGMFQGCTAQPSTTETCNGRDDNCDGTVDGLQQQCSNLVTAGGPATDNPGGNPASMCSAEGPTVCICHPGSKTCPAGGGGAFGSCLGEQGPLAEVCNGLDDDCDGRVDEGTGGADCSSNCGLGTLVCTNGNLMCNAVAATTDSTCDNVDDDCDGQVDENWVCADPPNCGCTDGTVCNGTESCVGGQVLCQGAAIVPESCNCNDDDCDGSTDEGQLCGSGATCIDCQCAFQCAPGEFPCPNGKTCDNGFCIADPCFGFTCPGDQVCKGVNNAPTCLDQCDPSLVTCQPGFSCVPDGPHIPGECLPDNCTTFPDKCTGTQHCINGECISNPCDGVTCGTDQYCLDGHCAASCADVTCGTDQICREGMCLDNPCGKDCATGEVCNSDSGMCVNDPCTVVQCPEGQYCDGEHNGMCVDDPCVKFGITCPHADETCHAGTCAPPPRPAENQYVTAAGGGCDAGGTPDVGGLAGVLLALGGIGARRRKGAR